MSERRKVLELFEQQEESLRKKISDGIERHRKGNALLTVVDASGQPLSNVTVKVKQKSHAFRFGANIFMLDELETEEKNEAYKKAFADLYKLPRNQDEENSMNNWQKFEYFMSFLSKHAGENVMNTCFTSVELNTIKNYLEKE